jgi:hypothetical protein
MQCSRLTDGLGADAINATLIAAFQKAEQFAHAEAKRNGAVGFIPCCLPDVAGASICQSNLQVCGEAA